MLRAQIQNNTSLDVLDENGNSQKPFKIPNGISTLATSVSESPYFKEIVKYRKKINIEHWISRSAGRADKINDDLAED